MKFALSKKNIWEKMPSSAKVGLGKMLKIIPLPHLIGKRFRQTMRFLQETQFWTHEEIHAYQLGRLQRMCALAFAKTEYYHRSFKQCGFDPEKFDSLDYFRQLPFTSRKTIQEHLEAMCTVSVNAPHVDYITTGGTTGAPLCFYTTSFRSQIEYAYLVSGWQRCGYELGMPVAVLRGKVIKKNSRGLFHEFDPMFNNHYYSSFHLTDENMALYVEHIRSLDSCYLHVYPSSIFYLARFLKRTGIKPPTNVEGILAESENVYPEQRQMVQEMFGCRYFSSYGHTEKLVAAVECEHSDNYHIWPTYGFFELIDEDGKVISESGQRGEIVGTGFINDVVPFIRYRTGDFATYVGDKCPLCGRNYTIIKDIRGHNTQEILIAYDNSMIPWSAINMHDDTFANVLRFQFYQDSPGKAVLKIIPTSSFKPWNLEKIRENLGKKFAGRLIFEIEFVKNINLSASGKSVFVDQRINTSEMNRVK